MLLADLLAWIEQFSTDEGRRMFSESGKEGVEAFSATVRRMVQMVSGAATHSAWPPVSFVFPDEDCLMVLLNPVRSARRRSATLLEEFAHHLRGHKPTRFFRDPVTGLLRREFDKAQEQEAYDFGSMLLLPKELIQQHVKERQGTAEELADRCGCSVELVEMRIKRCRLWARHLSNGNEMERN